ncbi:MAG TPA: M28 family peptidase, partial [Rhodothermales bacterium]|nr:M28 family peptidase [Rhodothermales bacterium]
MNRLSSILVLLLLFPLSSCRAQASDPSLPARATSAAVVPEDALSKPELAAELRFLASDELRGRKAGTPWSDVAARFIAEQFRAAGLKPAPGTDDFYQPVPLPRSLGNSENVAGILEGSDPNLRDEYVILMAHFDHVGTGMKAGPGATRTDSIFNGARDNGMGTVAVMAAARALAERPPARSVLFLAVTA